MIQKIGVVLTTPDAQAPTYATLGDTCADLYSSETVTIPAGKTRVISTGVIFNTPHGLGGFIRARSGLAAAGIFVHGGVLDSGYRGVVGVILHNSNPSSYGVRKGDRIAQIEFREVTQHPFVVVQSATSTERGGGGFGSTGR